jgi:hypothetical protein
MQGRRERCATRACIAIEPRWTTRYGRQLTMAFCPHCGTGLSEPASECPACGQSLGAKTKSAARFKGTMLTGGGQLQPAAPPANQPVAPAAAGSADTPRAISTRNNGTIAGVGLPPRDRTPAATPPAAAKSPRPPPPNAIVLQPLAGESRALPARAAATGHPAGRFVAGSVPPPLARQGGSRWVAIGLGGMALIATAGYLVAQFLGLIH